MKKLLLGLILILCGVPAIAAPKPITGSLSAAPAAGTRILAIGDSGKSALGAITQGRFSLVVPEKMARLYLLKDGKITGQIVLSKCQGKPSKPKKCSTKQVYTAFRSGKALGKISKVGNVYVVKAVSLGLVSSGSKVAARNSAPLGLASRGLSGRVAGARVVSRFHATAAGSTTDADKDGLVEALDVDDNDNGVIDNYDPSTGAQPENFFRIFSNFKLAMEKSLNLHATGLSTALVDAAMQEIQTLAIQVAGGSGDTTELDCGGLTYCSTGGTGTAPPQNGAPFPGTAGGSFDPDGDGYGTITKGDTGDFQLRTNATSASITSGDTFIQRVSRADGQETQIPGTLNFVFTSTPALRSLSISGGPEQSIDYTVTNNRLGSASNCIQVSSGGLVVLTVTGWRPQRHGVAAAGEAAFVDIGNSKISVDIPNSPISLGGRGGRGPGTCAVSAYSENDPNLSIVSDAIQDNKGDVDASSSNIYTFTVDIDRCLASGRNGPVAWNPGESLFIEIQFRSQDGDNSSQRICLKRDEIV